MAIFLFDEFLGSGPLFSHAADTGQVWGYISGFPDIVFNNGVFPYEGRGVVRSKVDAAYMGGDLYVQVKFDLPLAELPPTDFGNTSLIIGLRNTSGAEWHGITIVAAKNWPSSDWRKTYLYDGGGSTTLGAITTAGNTLDVIYSETSGTTTTLVNGAVIETLSLGPPPGPLTFFMQVNAVEEQIPDSRFKITRVVVSDSEIDPGPVPVVGDWWTNIVRCSEVK